MKILFLVSSMGKGGAERVAAMLCNGWANRGHQVTLIPTFSGKGRNDHWLNPAVNIEFLSDIVGGKIGRLGRVAAIRKMLRARRPDVVVSFLTDVNIAALLAAIFLRIPVVVAERTYPPRLDPQPSPLVQRLRRILYRRAAAIVAQTSQGCAWLSTECRTDKVHRIPNPVQQTSREGSQTEIAPHSKKRIIAVGRLIGSKRFDLLIRAYSDVASNHPEWSLVILGEGPETGSLSALAEKLKISDRVHFPGYRADIDNWYKSTDLFVLSSSYEGMPNALLEAMNAGLPCISFDIDTGPRDVITDGMNGILLPDNDHCKRLSSALNDLMTDAQLRDRIGKAAAEYVQRYHSMSAVLDHWDAVFAASLNNGRKRPEAR